jgi:hypothetical protein
LSHWNYKFFSNDEVGKNSKNSNTCIFPKNQSIKKEQIILNCLMIGAAGSGKSSILSSFVYGGKSFS